MSRPVPEKNRNTVSIANTVVKYADNPKNSAELKVEAATIAERIRPSKASGVVCCSNVENGIPNRLRAIPSNNMPLNANGNVVVSPISNVNPPCNTIDR